MCGRKFATAAKAIAVSGLFFGLAASATTTTGSVSYTYDSQGRVATAIYVVNTTPTPTTRTVTYTYDTAGNVKSVVVN